MEANAKKLILVVFLCLAFSNLSAEAQTVPKASPSPSTGAPTGKTPIIVIPGLTGSDLFNKNTNKRVWFSRSRSKDDDVRLPISPNLQDNLDSLEPRDILRTVKVTKLLPELEIYEQLIEGLAVRGGYREVKLDEADEDDYQDTFFVFPYDWRRDNVETARLLIRRVETLRRKIGKPDLKFNIIAHSMGGLVSRYAAMYGDADIPVGRPKPTWAGAQYFDKVFLIGTPNEGSVSALKALIDGYSYFGGGINLPFIRDINRFDVFTMPAAYQLLPHEGSLIVYDEDLKPVKLDIFDPETWKEYGWDTWNGEKFRSYFTPPERNNAIPYFRTVLTRAKRFHDALNANTSATIPIAFYLIGADCKETHNAMVVRRNENKDKWITQFNADSYETSDGRKITSKMLKSLIYDVGDSVVTKRSLTAHTITSNGGKYVLPLAGELLQCETHGKLVTNPAIQDKLIFILNGAAPKQLD